MPRTKGSKNKPKNVLTISEQIAETEAKIAELEETLKTAKNDLKELKKAKKEEDQAMIMDAINASGKSLEEILAMLSGTDHPEHEE